MFLIHCFGEKKIELLCWKIKYFINIKLKALSSVLINKVKFKEYLKARKRKNSAFVIMIDVKKI